MPRNHAFRLGNARGRDVSRKKHDDESAEAVSGVRRCISAALGHRGHPFEGVPDERLLRVRRRRRALSGDLEELVHGLAGYGKTDVRAQLIPILRELDALFIKETSILWEDYWVELGCADPVDDS
ncbi:MAG: hypothetical protein HKN10_15295 [Myxococcales bacterium]|nr:hypothetical protein [Myxococcales bacterium]